MDIIPTEIYITILSYLDVDTEVIDGSELETTKVLQAFPRELSQKDWVQLFTLRFPKLYHKSLYQYDVPLVYLELILLEPVVYTIKYSGKINDPTKFRHALKYLMINLFIFSSIETIAELDDIDLLFINRLRQDSNGKIIPTEYFTDNLGDELLYFIYQNSVNILNYIFSNDIITSNEDVDVIIEEVYRNATIDLKTTKVIFKHNKIRFGTMIDILLYYESEDMESYNYIFEMLPTVPENTIEELLNNYTDTDDIRYDTFIPIFDKYKNQLEENDIIAFYSNFMTSFNTAYLGESSIKNILYIVTELAQHPIIKRKYLRPRNTKK